MKLIMENWKRYLKESEEKKPTPEEAIAEEGGAVGLKKLATMTGISEEELREFIASKEEIEIHKDGDIIDTSGLSETNSEEVVVAEEEICDAGKAWAKRNYDKWPSAYASMGASKYCKDPNYGKDKKTNEGALKKWRDQNWTQSDGTPCGDAKAQSNPKRCKPASKWATMSSGEKKADNAKKKAGGKKGKQFVKATKKGEVKNA